MIAIPKTKKHSSLTSTPEWHEVFLCMAPAVETHAKIIFRHLRPESKAEAVQNSLCCACSATARLAELGKLDLCYSSVMATYAVKQAKEGRMVGGHLNCQDISSEYCQRRKDIVLERLDKFDETDECWREAFIPDQTCKPDELVASKLDFAAWIKTLKPRDRKIVRFLGAGHRTNETAKKFGLSKPRVSQLRRELQESWCNFCGEAEATDSKEISL